MMEKVINQGKILIVDDEKANVRFLEIVLNRAGFTDIHSTLDSRSALACYQAFYPDIVLLDLSMPHLDGFGVMRQIQQLGEDSPAPVLVLTADINLPTKLRALSEGAKDFLAKPLDEAEVLLRIRNLLETRLHSKILEATVRERTWELEVAQIETLQRLALAAEYRDDETGQHTKRVGMSASLMARELGLPAGRVELILQVAPLHDVGKIGIADAILLKPGKLTEDEFATMKQHTVIGAGMLSGSTSARLQLAEEIAHSHHERWDGRGYPMGLSGEEIPLGGRIVAVADVFDALTHERPYKAAWSVADALAEIKSQAGRQFDETVLNAFLNLDHTGLV